MTGSSVSKGRHKTRQLELAHQASCVEVRTATRTVRSAIANYKAAEAAVDAGKRAIADGKLAIAAACIELAEETHRELQNGL